MIGKIKCLFSGFNANASQKKPSIFFKLLRKRAEKINQLSNGIVFIMPTYDIDLDFDEEFYEAGRYGKNELIQTKLVPFSSRRLKEKTTKMLLSRGL